MYMLYNFTMLNQRIIISEITKNWKTQTKELVQNLTIESLIEITNKSSQSLKILNTPDLINAIKEIYNSELFIESMKVNRIFRDWFLFTFDKLIYILDDNDEYSMKNSIFLIKYILDFQQESKLIDFFDLFNEAENLKYIRIIETINSIKNNTNIIFAFDNKVQYDCFKRAARTIKNKNDTNEVTLNILFNTDKFEIDLKMDLIKFLDEENLLFRNLYEINDNTEFGSRGMFYWTIAPFLNPRIDRFILFDNDLYFNADFKNILTNSSNEKTLSGVPVPNFIKGDIKPRMAKWFCSDEYIEKNERNHINLGVAVLNATIWRSKHISKEHLITQFLDWCTVVREQGFHYHDQDFAWIYHGDNMGKIPNQFNIRLHTNEKELLSSKDEWILHYNLWAGKNKFDFVEFFEKGKLDSKGAINYVANFYKLKISTDWNREMSKREKEIVQRKAELLLGFIK